MSILVSIMLTLLRLGRGVRRGKKSNGPLSGLKVSFPSLDGRYQTVTRSP